MKLREKLQWGKQVFVPMLVLGAFGILIWNWINAGTGHRSAVDTVWVYNLNTEAFTTMPIAQAVPPIELDDGVGYKAIVFTCGSCSADERRVAYLSQHAEHGQDASGEPVITEMIASVEMAKNGEWVPGSFFAKSQFMDKAIQSCPESFQACLP